MVVRIGIRNAELQRHTIDEGGMRKGNACTAIVIGHVKDKLILTRVHRFIRQQRLIGAAI